MNLQTKGRWGNYPRHRNQCEQRASHRDKGGLRAARWAVSTWLPKKVFLSLPLVQDLSVLIIFCLHKYTLHLDYVREDCPTTVGLDFFPTSPTFLNKETSNTYIVQVRTLVDCLKAKTERNHITKFFLECKVNILMNQNVSPSF